MFGKKARRTALVCLLLLLIVACLAWRNYSPANQDSLERFNLTWKSGVACFNGRGNLQRDDVKILLEREEKNLDDLVDVEIGDDVTGLGFNCFGGCADLRTVKLGKNVSMLDSYAFVSCEKLKCLYWPVSIDTVGKGIFDNCNMLSIFEEVPGITKGYADVESRAIVTVDWDSMTAIRTDDSAFPEQFPFMGGYSDGRGIVLEPGGIQYGPYISLPAGNYHVEITGSGLESLSENSIRVSANNGKAILSHRNLIIEENLISYDFTLDTGADRIEYCVTNRAGTDITITSISRSTIVELPQIVKRWKN